MAESAKTSQMYRGGLDHEEDAMPQSLTEAGNAARSEYTPELSDPENVSYDMETVGDAFEAYEEIEETFYGERGLTEDQNALSAFGELFSEN